MLAGAVWAMRPKLTRLVLVLVLRLKLMRLVLVLVLRLPADLAGPFGCDS